MNKIYLITYEEKDGTPAEFVTLADGHLIAAMNFMVKHGGKKISSCIDVKKDRADAMEKFLFFTANFREKFIEDCWADEKVMANHFREKFDGIWFSSSTNGLETMLKFCFALDVTNREKLFRWIDENYNYKSKGGSK